MRPHKRQFTRLPRPWDSPGKNNTFTYLLIYIYIYTPLSAHLTVNSLKESLAVQLTLAFTARAWIQSLVQELRSLQAVWGTNKTKTNQTEKTKPNQTKQKTANSLKEGSYLFFES